jgi:hypothetical protein
MIDFVHKAAQQQRVSRESAIQQLRMPGSSSRCSKDLGQVFGSSQNTINWAVRELVRDEKIKLGLGIGL